MRRDKGVGLKAASQVLRVGEGAVARCVFGELRTDHPAFDAAFPGHIPGELMALGRMRTELHHVPKDGERCTMASGGKGAEGGFDRARIGIVAIDDDGVALRATVSPR